MKAVQWGEALGGWEALPEKEIFDLEYWELEQAKLKPTPSRKEFDGKIVMVSGAASGIGKACTEAFMAYGAAVVALDIDQGIEQLFDDNNCMGVVCDITSEDSTALQSSLSVNFIGHVSMMRECLPYLKRGSRRWSLVIMEYASTHCIPMRYSIQGSEHSCQLMVAMIA